MVGDVCGDVCGDVYGHLSGIWAHNRLLFANWKQVRSILVWCYGLAIPFGKASAFIFD